jgi:hypothetical protein
MPRTEGAKGLKNRDFTAMQPAKPSNLSARASLEWDRLTRELERANIQVTPPLARRQRYRHSIQSVPILLLQGWIIHEIHRLRG